MNAKENNPPKDRDENSFYGGDLVRPNFYEKIGSKVDTFFTFHYSRIHIKAKALAIFLIAFEC